MIQGLESAPLVVGVPEISDEERAAGIATLAEHDRNVSWWNAHSDEIVALHAGKYVCVAGQELFVGDDPVEVTARAEAAHPEPGRGFFCTRIPTHRGPMIYAIQRALGACGREHLAADDLRRS